MTTIEAGTQVKKGYYFNVKTWTLEAMANDGAALPGTKGEKYFHVPLLLAFVVAPLMGAAFLMFLPFIGFYLAFSAALRPVTRLFSNSATELAATMSPGWAPGVAHLAGKAPEAKEGEQAPAAKDGLEGVAAEVSQRRSERE